MSKSNRNHSSNMHYGPKHSPLQSNKKEILNQHSFQNSIDDAWDVIDIKECTEESLSKTSILLNDKNIYPSLNNISLKKYMSGPGIGKKAFVQNCDKNSFYNNYGNGEKHLFETSEKENIKIQKLSKILHNDINRDDLVKYCWSGIPAIHRPICWKILSHYVPLKVSEIKETLIRKRIEYFAFVEKYYPFRLDNSHKDMYRQIHIDIPRMNPLIDLFQQKTVQQMFERILYIWSIRHPASGYVQGINDLVTPFFVVFLSEYVSAGSNVETFPIETLPQETLNEIEADSFWCLSNLLDGIQDNYTFAQPGIQEKVNTLKHLISRTNAPLFNHLSSNDVEFLQFAFRWMNNLLMREIPLKCTIRLWDTYLSEQHGFSHFHLYVCVAFLNSWSNQILRERDFQGIMLLIQNLPTKDWNEDNMSILLAEAYKLKYLFADSPRHLMSNTPPPPPPPPPTTTSSTTSSPNPQSVSSNRSSLRNGPQQNSYYNHNAIC